MERRLRDEYARADRLRDEVRALRGGDDALVVQDLVAAQKQLSQLRQAHAGLARRCGDLAAELLQEEAAGALSRAVAEEEETEEEVELAEAFREKEELLARSG